METVQILDYTEKSFVVFGNTKPIKELLQSLGGKFNRFLKREGNVFAGWVFALNKREQVEQLIAAKPEKIQPMQTTQGVMDVLTAFAGLSEADKKEFLSQVNEGEPKNKPVKSKKRLPANSYNDKLKKLVGLKIKTIVPVMDDYVMLTKDGYLIRTNLESTYAFKQDFKPTEDILLPLTVFKTFGKDEVIVDIKFKTDALSGKVITNKKGIDFTGYKVDDFPKLPELDEKNVKTFQLTPELFERVKAMSKFCNNDELRPVMGGVYMSEYRMAATDAHKLCHEEIGHGAEIEMILSRWSMPYMISGTAQTDGRTLYVESENEFCYTRLVDGKYPNYMAVLPADKDLIHRAKVNRLQLIEDLKQLLVVANKTTNQIRFNFATGKMKAEDLDLSQSMELDIPTTDKPDIEIGYNGKFLIECLQHLKDETVELKMWAPNRATLIGNTLLLMPVMLNQ